MRLLVLLLLSGVLSVAPGSAPAAPPALQSPASAATSLTLPDTDVTIRLGWRQLDTDLSRFREGAGWTDKELHKLRVQCVFTQDGSLQANTSLRVGARTLPPGRYPLGFTVGDGGRLNYFVVAETEAVPLDFEAFEVGWPTSRLLMQAQYVSPHEVRLYWHLGATSGRLRVGIDWPAEYAWPPPEPPAPEGAPAADGAPPHR